MRPVSVAVLFPCVFEESDLCAECCVCWNLLVRCEFVCLQVCVAIVEMRSMMLLCSEGTCMSIIMRRCRN